MKPSPARKSSGRGPTPALSVVLRNPDDNTVLAREDVRPPDLSDAFSEAWRDACLRKGHPDVPLAEVSMRVLPKLQDGSDQLCAGFDLEVCIPNQPPLRHAFTMRCLRHVSQRAAQHLVESGALRTGQTYTFELVADPGAKNAAEDQSLPSLHTHIKTVALTCLPVPLREVLEQATPVDVVDDDLFAVFYTEHALRLAEKFARKGADAVPAVETGGVLMGSLCSCPRSGEFFVVVTDVLEVMDAEQKEFALAYTSQTWTRLQTILRARQTAHPERAERMLGQCHGHNFLPGEGKTCERCLQQPVCGLTNLFVSLDDQQWSRAVFARQPWQLCHIFGLTARGDRVNALFTLLDGRLQSRGYFKLPDFHPEHWTKQPIQEELSHA